MAPGSISPVFGQYSKVFLNSSSKSHACCRNLQKLVLNKKNVREIDQPLQLMKMFSIFRDNQACLLRFDFRHYRTRHELLRPRKKK